MLTAIVRAALSFPRLVLFASMLFAAYGASLLMQAQFEVFPEFVPAQAGVQVEAPGLTAGQVELLVTRPLEEAINGATGIASVRSRSIQGLAVIDVTFREGEDPYRARQVVAERLAEVAGRLPAGTGSPVLSPLTSSTMDLIKIGLISDRLSPLALRDLAQWTLRPRLLATPGVARVNIFGGELARLEVRVSSDALIAHDLALGDVVAAVKAATATRGGGYVDTDAQRILIEPHGAALSASDLARVPLVQSAGAAPGGPITLGDIAEVVEAASPKFGDALVMGRPGVLLSLSSQFGANTLTTTRAVEAALAEIGPMLEAEGVTIYPALHRPANFIETALAGIRGDLLLGTLFITLVLIAFTRDLRVALVAFVAIPMSLLAAVMVFDVAGQVINTMVLGGLAVALGVVIDDAVIGTENILRRLRDRGERPALTVILEACVEVRAPVVYATFVLGLTVAPILLLSGLQGAFFAPLAAAFLIAIFASLLVAVTLTPALAFLFLRQSQPPAEPAALHRLKQLHLRLLGRLIHRPLIAAGLTVALGLGSVAVVTQFGSELLPAFRERHYVLAVNGPSGASLDWMRQIGTRIAKDLLAIPGIATAEQQIGRAEAGEDTFPPSRSEIHVELEKVDGKEEERVMNAIRAALDAYPGLQTEVMTFLGDRIGESLSGETAAIVISAYGPDLEALDRMAEQIAAVVRSVPGAVDVQVQTPPGAPGVTIDFDPAALARRGIDPTDVYDAIEASYQGLTVAQVTVGQKVSDVAVVLANTHSRDPEAAGQILVRGANGQIAPLSSVASIRLGTARATIGRDGGRRRQVVTANSDAPDVAALATRIRQAISDKVSLPSGVYLEYSGVAEGQAAAQREILLNVSMAAIGIVALLMLAFGGWRPALLILLSTPSALAGGVAAVTLAGGILSLGGLVGFVTLFGIAARNGILLVSHTDHLISKEGAVWGADTVMRATSERVAPIVMTALVTCLGMAPLAFGAGEAGREIQGPMAEVILGGLATSTILVLFLLPPLVLALRHRSGDLTIR